MTAKFFKDEDGNVLCSDEIIFEENPDDIIDDLYIKDAFYREPQEIYTEILEENEIHSKKLFKGGL